MKTGKIETQSTFVSSSQFTKNRTVATRLLGWAGASAVVGFLLFGPGPNTALAVLALFVLLAIVGLSWRPGEPPVFLCIFLFQWLESSVWVFWANATNVRIGASPTDPGRELATILLLIGLTVQAAGVRLGIGAWNIKYRRLVELQLDRISQWTWLRVYLAAFGLAAVCEILARLIPPLSQPFLACTHLKWAAYIILTIATFYRSDASKRVWLLIFSLELLLSVGGYFSSFKFVFFFTFIGVAAAQMKLSARNKLVLGGLTTVAILFGIIWSAIKVEYRHFVSAGQRAQVVTVEYAERLEKLAELTSALDRDGLAYGSDVLLRRLEYVEYFGHATVYVPRSLPHTNGERWLDAITRPVMPRLFFPDKPIIDESLITNRYTGLSVAGMAQGTQVSIGYIAETYIDFGRYGMMAVLLLWGLLVGRVYRWLIESEYSGGLLGMAIASAIFVMTASSVGNSLAKLVGGMSVSLLVAWCFIRFVVPRWLPWLRPWTKVAVRPARTTVPSGQMLEPESIERYR